MTPLQALIDARALIAEPERWTQGAFAKDVNGSLARAQGDQATCWCPIGAIDRTFGADFDTDAAVLAYGALADVVGRADLVTKWNDRPERTHAEVLAAFDAAIARLEAQQ